MFNSNQLEQLDPATPPGWRQQRMLALLMTLLSAGLFGVCSGNYFYAGFIVILTTLGVSGRYEIKIRRSRQVILFLFIALAYALYYRLLYLRTESPGSSAQQRLQAQVAIQYFLLLMAGLFYASGPRPVSPWIMICGIIAVLASGQLITDPNRNQWFGLFALLYLAMMIVMGMMSRVPVAPDRRPLPFRIRLSRGLLSGTCLALTLALGWYGGDLLNRYHGQLVSLVFRMNLQSFNRSRGRAEAIGFAKSSMLNNMGKIKLTNANQVAFRIFSDQPPGYLRNQVFEIYIEGEWQSASATREVQPVENELLATQMGSFGKLFQLSDSIPNDPQTLIVWPAPHIDSGMFAPLGAAAVQTAVETVEIEDNGIIDSDGLRTGIQYAIALDARYQIPQLGPNPPEAYLRIPSSLSQPARTLAGSLFKDCPTSRAKIDAVIRFFHQNYNYQLGIEVPRRKDPLNYFLESRPPAHCEFFASGATILLRLAGVPTRYVTGAVADEYNSVGGYWVARNRDAHAWCEAWDAEQGQWVLVEATPATGIPQRTETGFLAGLLEMLRLKLQELSVSYIHGGFRGIFAWLGGFALVVIVWLISTPQGLATLAILLAYGFWRRWHRRHRHSLRPVPDEWLEMLGDLLGRMDRALGQKRTQRLTGETLHQYAHRLLAEYPDEPFIEQAAHWYRHYAAIRYGAPGDLERARQLGDQIPAQSNR